VPFRDLPDFITTLDREGLLRRIRAEVSQDLEISEIYARVVKAKGPALLFENVAGQSMPVAINLFGTSERIAMALGVKDLDQLPSKLTSLFLGLVKPAGGFLEKLKLVQRLGEVANLLPKRVNDGVCKEVIQKEGFSLDRFPVLKCWPEDGGRFITFPLVFTHDPESGNRNCGVYRMQVYGPTTTGMHFHPHKDAARHLRKSGNKPLPCACVIGCDPAVCFSATVPLPPDVDEMILAGIIRGEGVKMIRCESIDVEVPANSEIVLEGYIDPAEQRVEGPFGDHTGFYSSPERFPVFHITCITHRRSPIYHATVVGPPPQEDSYIGKAIERLFLPLLRLHLPEIVDYNLPFEGVFHNLMLISIKKEYPGHARKVMHSIWGMGQAMFTKVILVVDEDVNVQDPKEVVFKALANIDPERDIEFSRGPLHILDHASELPGYGSKIGIDATRKWVGEGVTRGWPKEVRMLPQIRDLVDKKWERFGI
jgi:4-hydroxy-3-polyprenylbenzoate decarboxylase